MSVTGPDGEALPAWAIPPAEAAEVASSFIGETVRAAGAGQVVVGLSGGIDSAVAASLAVRALGPENVLGVLLPYATSAPASTGDARAVASQLGIRTERVEITPLVTACDVLGAGAEPVRLGNVMARVRMILLYDISARDGSLVLGTGNRSEALLGYTTLFGDNACALNPLGRLYKTEVRALARYLQLPPQVISKPPSADLWVGQSDEEELGFTYAEADRLLHHLVDERLGERQLAALGFAPDLVAKVTRRVNAMAFKRKSPPAAWFDGRPEPDSLPAGSDPT